jgi:hypothetical protein
MVLIKTMCFSIKSYQPLIYDWMVSIVTAENLFPIKWQSLQLEFLEGANKYMVFKMHKKKLLGPLK